MSLPIAVIYGAGPGTGAAIARAFAPTHRLVLMSRSLPGSYAKLELGDLNQDAILAAKYDGTQDSFKAAIRSAQDKWPGAIVNLGVCHAGATFKPGPFLEKTTQDVRDCLDSAVQAWDFFQALIPVMLSGNKSSGGTSTLIMTGATMSVRGSADFADMAAGQFARRALSQSLAREFGPQGIHVAHVVIDGLIATSRVEGMMGKAEEGTRLKAEDVAQTYVDIANQKPSCWTREMDLRPMVEKDTF